MKLKDIEEADIPSVVPIKNRPVQEVTLDKLKTTGVWEKEEIFGQVKVVRNNNYEWGVTDLMGNIIVPFGKYAWIDGFEQGLARVRGLGKLYYPKNIIAIMGNERCYTNPQEIQEFEEKNRLLHPEQYSKWGIIDETGEEVLPVEYDAVWKFFGKHREFTRVVKNGVSHNVYFRDLLREVSDDDESYDEERHYEEFAGTYAQDVAGYSDEDIYDAFDGEPDAYWNID